MVYFTADCHFGHGNIIKYCKRPFANVDEMDEVMIKNWNERVGPQDDVFIIGDLMFFTKYPGAYLERLGGRKHLIIGNHDGRWMAKGDFAYHFESVSRMEVMKMDGKILTLCHFPMMTWEERGEKGILIYGHIHNTIRDDFWPLLSKMDDAFNAGVEINDYRPVTLDELEKNNRDFKRGGQV